MCYACCFQFPTQQALPPARSVWKYMALIAVGLTVAVCYYFVAR